MPSTPAPGCDGTTYEILKQGDGKEVRVRRVGAAWPRPQTAMS